MGLTKDQITEVKGKGFLQNRGTENFSGRIVQPASSFTSADLAALGECADKFGDGEVCFTSRLCAEIVGIPYENIQPAIDFMAEHNLYFGGTGAKVRPVTNCKGTTCVFGNFDTKALARKLHEDYYLGKGDVKLPHKFKIGVGGCPNSCMKPSINDFGIEGHKTPIYDAEQCKGCKVCNVEVSCPVKACSVVDGKMVIDQDKCITCGVCVGKCPFKAVADEAPTKYQIYVGGTWGKSTRMGTPLSRQVEYDEIFPIIDKTIEYFKANAQPKERLGKMIDRLGVDELEKNIL